MCCSRVMAIFLISLTIPASALADWKNRTLAGATFHATAALVVNDTTEAIPKDDEVKGRAGCRPDLSAVHVEEGKPNELLATDGRYSEAHPQTLDDHLETFHCNVETVSRLSDPSSFPETSSAQFTSFATRQTKLSRLLRCRLAH